MKKRLAEELKKLLTIIMLLILAVVIYERLGLALFCPFHRLTGLYCPGCGVSRMGVRLVHGDMRGAWRYNQAVMLILPLTGYIVAAGSLRYILSGERKNTPAERIIIYIMIFILLAYGVLRNMSFYPVKI